MPFKVTYQIDPAVFEAAESEVVWLEVQKLSITQLLSYLKKFLKSRGWKISIAKTAPDNLGEHWVPEGRITLSLELQLAELPAILIHELFHGVFEQLDEERILALESKVMQSASAKQLGQLVHFAFRYGNWEYTGPAKKRVL